MRSVKKVFLWVCIVVVVFLMAAFPFISPSVFNYISYYGGGGAVVVVLIALWYPAAIIFLVNAIPGAEMGDLTVPYGGISVKVTDQTKSKIKTEFYQYLSGFLVVLIPIAALDVTHHSERNTPLEIQYETSGKPIGFLYDDPVPIPQGNSVKLTIFPDKPGLHNNIFVNLNCKWVLDKKRIIVENINNCEVTIREKTEGNPPISIIAISKVNKHPVDDVIHRSVEFTDE